MPIVTGSAEPVDLNLLPRCVSDGHAIVDCFHQRAAANWPAARWARPVSAGARGRWLRGAGLWIRHCGPAAGCVLWCGGSASGGAFRRAAAGRILSVFAAGAVRGLVIGVSAPAGLAVVRARRAWLSLRWLRCGRGRGGRIRGRLVGHRGQPLRQNIGGADVPPSSAVAWRSCSRPAPALLRAC
jgi:hypothetical protein